MSQIQKIISALGLVALIGASHASAAEEQARAYDARNTAVKPLAKKIAPAPDGDAMQGLEAPSAGPAKQKKEETPDPAITPYLTYDGATTSNSDR